ncbi:MAG: heat-inducible transcriptional repressor HrcA [Tissierellia bacterium]|nr:heat-inducible transcriptional repressor HrcA [Tissierellia bacterium]
MDERKIEILKAIIYSYIDLAEPIGSRTISKLYDLGISSATIRNEMADLEDMGYLIKPHTSAGRIPSDKAYRFYVDSLLENLELDIERQESLKKEMEKKLIDDNEEPYKRITKALSDWLNYTTVTLVPTLRGSQMKYLKLLYLGNNLLKLLIVADSGEVEDYDFYIDEDFDFESVDKLSNYLNIKLSKKSTADIKAIEFPKEMSDIELEISEFSKNKVIDFLERGKEYRIYSTGIGNIMTFNDLKDTEELKKFLDFFEDSETIFKSLFLNSDDYETLKITIGAENSAGILKNCSVISAKYRIDPLQSGDISIIGPTRMDYYRLIRAILMYSKNLSELNDLL